MMQTGWIAASQAGDSIVPRLAAQLRTSLGEKVFTAWFPGKTTIHVEGTNVTCIVASQFLAAWFSQQFRGNIAAAAGELLGEPVTVRFVADPEAAVKSNIPSGVVSEKHSIPATAQFEERRKSDSMNVPSVPLPRQLATVSRAPRSLLLASTATRDRPTHTSLSPSVPTRAPTQLGSAKTEPAPTAVNSSGGLRRGAELSEFVVYPGNEHAVTATRLLLQDTDRSPRCVYLYSGVGLGKTHLAEAAYRQWRRIRPDRQAMMLASDAFGNSYSKALREKSLPSFRQKFRSLELLILDDAEFFDGKHGFQDELLNLVRHLQETGRRVLVTADRHPRLLQNTSEGLISRFLSGAVARIEAPALDARRNLIQSKARRMELSLPSEVCDYVAARFVRDIRELEGALNILATLMSREEPVSLGAAKQVLGEFERDCVRVVQLTDIIDAVCQVFGVSRSDLQSERRSKTLSEPRMLAMFLARELTRTTYQEIGRQFGGRNHSTVVAAEKKIDAAVRNRVEIRLSTRTWTMDRLVDALRQRLIAG